MRPLFSHSKRFYSTKVTFGKYPFLKELGIKEFNKSTYDGKSWIGNGKIINSLNPYTGEIIAEVQQATKEEYNHIIEASQKAQKEWAKVPAPIRGELVRQIGEEFRKKKEALGSLVSLEMGKIYQEGLGEVQEAIDMCDYATGLSRCLNGTVFPSERPLHTLQELWNPLGVVGVISAFNFPSAVYAWNSTLGLICGNSVIWKGASSTSLVTIATNKIMTDVLERNGYPGAICCTIGGSSEIGDLMTEDIRVPLISFTGSTEIGRRVAVNLSKRFGRQILELGGNNAIIVMDDANIDLAVRGSFFAAVGTAGQRCTTARRIILHEKIYNEYKNKFVKAYGSIRMGDPLDPKTICGPLHSKQAVVDYENAIKKAIEQGGKVLIGGKVLKDQPGNMVEPTIIEIAHDAPIVWTETFVPIVYLIKTSSFEEAVQINNEVPQGLSSSLFTTNPRLINAWRGPNGSDCGLVNVNVPTNGAEIGGAFGGEKEGCGREAGSDCWKQYCRRSTCTTNFSNDLPLAQGIKFE